MMKEEGHLIPKLKVLAMFCERKMAGSVDIQDHEEWLKIKERIELWMKDAGEEK